jgi:hypothetical protein
MGKLNEKLQGALNAINTCMNKGIRERKNKDEITTVEVRCTYCFGELTVTWDGKLIYKTDATFDEATTVDSGIKDHIDSVNTKTDMRRKCVKETG